MKQKFKVVIFTDLDGSLLHRDTFKFDPIKDYIVSLVDRGIIIIPNSSKTQKEIENFNEELGVKLPYISENGSAIQGLNLINPSNPAKFKSQAKIAEKKEKWLFTDCLGSQVSQNNLRKGRAAATLCSHKERVTA